MKKLLTSFAKYDLWANEALFAVVLQLTKLQQREEIKSSFPSIHKTCFHLLDAYSIWWQRLLKIENIVVPSQVTNYSTTEIVSHILQLNGQWVDWLQTASDTEVETNLSYKNMHGEIYKQPIQEIVLHVCNHGTYHRGQLVTMFRQVGVEEIPQTDYIFYTRC